MGRTIPILIISKKFIDIEHAEQLIRKFQSKIGSDISVTLDPVYNFHEIEPIELAKKSRYTTQLKFLKKENKRDIMFNIFCTAFIDLEENYFDVKSYFGLEEDFIYYDELPFDPDVWIKYVSNYLFSLPDSVWIAKVELED